MSFKLSELLNPAPSTGLQPSPTPHPEDLPPSPPPPQQQHQQQPQPQQNRPIENASLSHSHLQSHSRNSSYGDQPAETSDHDAANALADLATSEPLPLSPSNKANVASPARSTHQASYSRSPPRPLSSYTLAAIPLEPSPPLERAQQPYSPTLDQYHHSSRSTVHHRRQSWVSSRNSPPPRLAPIQSYPETAVDHQDLEHADNNANRGANTDPYPTIDTMMDAEQMKAPSHLESKSEREPRGASISDLPPVAPEVKDAIDSPQPSDVKAEPPETPGLLTPQTPALTVPPKDEPPEPVAVAVADAPSVSSNADVKQEGATVASSEDIQKPPKATPTAPAGKKRAAPKSGAKAEKKKVPSTIKKPASKKRRLDSEGFDVTPSSRRSETPASRASKTPAPRNRKQTSATPASSSPAPSHANEGGVDEDEVMADADVDYEEGAELFCICRKPDNHTWMIGCDGGCEDWFHGKCVQIKEEDGELIDKYICPNCEKENKGHTTWKPMCRLTGCRKPARVTGKHPSKYCSDDHGREFMHIHSHKHRSKTNGSEEGHNKKKRRKDNYTDHDWNGAIEDEEMEESRGGVLRGGELKAVVEGVKDLKEFRTVGDQLLPSQHTDADDVEMQDAGTDAPPHPDVTFTTEEETKLAEITGKKDALRTRRAILEDREIFLALVRERAKEVKELEGVKDLCGYDSRLTWSDDEFSAWRAGAEGQKAFDSRVLGGPATTADASDSAAAADACADGKEAASGVCTKKRCERHKQWLKIQQQELAFEKDVLRQDMRALDHDEKELRQGAVVRTVEARGQEHNDAEQAPPVG